MTDLMKSGTCSTNPDESSEYNFEISTIHTAIHNFFIIDLLKAQYLADQKLFEVYNIQFHDITIMGYLVKIKPYQETFILTVDDSTSSIEVFIEEEYIVAVKKLKTLSINDKNNCTPANFPKESINLIVQAMKDSTNKIKSVDEFTIGDLLLISGNLSKWEERRRIFSRSIKYIPDNESTGILKDWIIDRINFYSENDLTQA